MTIPTTKASTQYVDQPTDLISNARGDIKQNIDNVNEIIDHLDAQDGTFVSEASININNSNVFDAPTGIFAEWTLNSDAANLMTYDSAGTVTLTAGKYRFYVDGIMTDGATNNTDWTLRMFGEDFTIKDDEFINYTRFVDLTTNNTSDILLIGENQSGVVALNFNINVFFSKIG